MFYLVLFAVLFVLTFAMSQLQHLSSLGWVLQFFLAKRYRKTSVLGLSLVQPATVWTATQRHRQAPLWRVSQELFLKIN